MRSYHPENSRSQQNTELKPDWACLVLTWVTSGESQVTHFLLRYVAFSFVCFILLPHRPCWPNGRSESLSLSLANADILLHLCQGFPAVPLPAMLAFRLIISTILSGSEAAADDYQTAIVYQMRSPFSPPRIQEVQTSTSSMHYCLSWQS